MAIDVKQAGWMLFSGRLQLANESNLREECCMVNIDDGFIVRLHFNNVWRRAHLESKARLSSAQ